MNGIIRDFVERKKYGVPHDAYTILNQCDEWYQNKCIASFHKRKTVQGESYELRRMNFAKRACQDDANLCEIVSINPGEGNEYISDILKENRFDTQFRRQLEKVAAMGTAAAYIRLENAVVMSDGSITGGNIKINYVDAENYIPLTIVNDEVIEAAMSGCDVVKGKSVYTVVIFKLGDSDGNDKENYYASTYKLNYLGKLIEAQEDVKLGDVKPFAILRTAEVNNLEHMEGFGLPKIYSGIASFETLDLAFNIFRSDLDKGEKMLLVNELLCGFDKNGDPITPSEQAKKTFVMLGEKLPNKDTLIHEYNPQIRTEDATKAIELSLSMLSMIFGYGTKRYTFESGKITTATQYIGERQDEMQDLNKQRYQVREYIEGIVKAIAWFAMRFKDIDYTPTDDGILIDFDDSYIEDRASQLESMRLDAQQFGLPKLVRLYLMKRYNLTEDAAKEWYEDIEEEDDETKEV